MENKEMINYIEKYLSDLKFKTEYKGKNLIMSINTLLIYIVKMRKL